MSVLPNANSIIRQWIEDLQSNNYKQGHESLHITNKQDIKFCCLGVLCATQKDKLELTTTNDGCHEWYHNRELDEQSFTGLLRSVRTKLGISDKIHNMLIGLNDKSKFTFPQIAQVLQNMLDQGLIGELANRMLPNAKQIIVNWIDTLRSGKYAQTTGYLHKTYNGEDSFCCLGVLCHTNQDVLEPVTNGNVYQYYGSNSTSLTKATMEKLGIPSKIQDMLMGLNDEKRFTFNQIADVVEELLNNNLIGDENTA